MTRVIVEGIPVWKNGGGELFYYEPELTEQIRKIGTMESGFLANWKEVCADSLAAYRNGQKVRPREFAQRNSGLRTSAAAATAAQQN
jgi:hypothetical protein